MERPRMEKRVACLFCLPLCARGQQLNFSGAILQSALHESANGDEHAWWQSSQVQKVCTFLLIIAIGKSMQHRFPHKEAGAVQNLLLSFLLPAMLFKSSAKVKLEFGHMAYLGGGLLLVALRFLASALAAYAAFGRGGKGTELATLRRSAIFENSSTATAMSILPFINEFVGVDFVGLGGVVDLPMKLYTLIMMPFLMRNFGETYPATSGDANGKLKFLKTLAQLLTDPLIASVVLGMFVAFFTDGAGTARLGFVGNAIDLLAAAQTPCLFLLIGLKLTFASRTPLFCVVLLFGSQGVMLITVWLFLLLANTGETMSKFVIFFVQGAPKFTLVGYMQSALDAGVQGWSPDFALDIVGMAFPISSCMQCLAAIMGASFVSAAGLIGASYLAVAVVLRVIFRDRFLLDKRENTNEQSELEASAGNGFIGA